MSVKTRLDRVEKIMSASGLDAKSLKREQERIAVQRDMEKFADLVGIPPIPKLFELLEMDDGSGLDMNQRVRRFLDRRKAEGGRDGRER